MGCNVECREKMPRSRKRYFLKEGGDADWCNSVLFRFIDENLA